MSSPVLEACDFCGLEPLYVMVDLALGGGWPIDHPPNPSFLYVDYIRVWTPGAPGL